MKRFSSAVLTLVLGLVLSSPAWALSGSDDKGSKEQVKTVYDTLKQHSELAKFTDMISEAGLKDLFQSKDTTITVFAPTNDAIGDISRADRKKIDAGKDSLQNFVKAQIVVGSRITSNSINGRKFSSAAANGDTIAFDGTSTKDAAKINTGHVVNSDINVGNSVVHIVSAAMIPSAFVEKEPPKSPEMPKIEETKASDAETGSPASGVDVVKGKKDKAKASSSVDIPVTADTPAPAELPAAAPASSDQAAPQKSGGFSLFGHHFGGN